MKSAAMFFSLTKGVRRDFFGAAANQIPRDPPFSKRETNKARSTINNSYAGAGAKIQGRFLVKPYDGSP
jgi:hypothetical protein